MSSAEWLPSCLSLNVLNWSSYRSAEPQAWSTRSARLQAMSYQDVWNYRW